MSEVEKGDDIFDLDRIRSLIDLMKEHELSEIDLRQDEQRIRLCRGGEPMVAAAPAPAPIAAAAPVAASSSTADPDNIVTVKSPMVGTFYSKPNPESPNFVKVGDNVTNETVVCIIEAMKVFNEIPAETRGQIVAILVDNEEPVEFGKPLFKIDTSK